MRPPVPAVATTVSASALLRQSGQDGSSEWAAPAPLWGSPTDVAGMRRPTLLRFASDRFIEEAQALLASEAPGDLAGKVARPESFAEPVPAVLGVPRPAPSRLKLYQPAHGHFYLVTASLVCRRSGLPDRQLARDDSVGFVLRRIDGDAEMAWVHGEGGARWQRLAPEASERLAGDASAAAAEEVFPLFPLAYCDGVRRRRVWAGLVPTASRETFTAAATLPLMPSAAEVAADRAELDPRRRDPRLEALEARVLTALEQFEGAGTTADPMDGEASLFVALDLMEWLLTYLPAFAERIVRNERPTEGRYRLLAALLASRSVPDGRTWWQVLRHVWRDRATIYRTMEGEPAALTLRGTTAISNDLRQAITALASSFDPSRPELPGTPGRPASEAGHEIPKLEGAVPGDPPRFVLRCVYRRPGCPAVLSATSEAFEIASFFDPEAPARPVRISLPATDLAALRKGRKPVSFLMSKELRRQLDRVGDLKRTLDGDLKEGKDLDLGQLCSFSLPIITICAFVVLSIFLSLLNLVFWWRPFVRTCIPIKR